MVKQNRGISTRHNPSVSSKTATAGITLIGLVITIILLLILAGVSIVTLTGENGILTQTEKAKRETTYAEVEERIQLEMLASIDNNGKYSKNKALENLDNNLNLTKNNGDIIEYSDGTIMIKYKGYKFDIGKNGKVNEALKIGEAINADKYGWKVNNYKVRTEETGGWRLFFQDDNYTYLISDNCIENVYIDNFGSYTNGSTVSNIGQKLNSKICSLFTETNTYENIRTTAALTDSEKWTEYKSEDAYFAIACPTAELFVASYNATGKANTILLESGTYGYRYNPKDSCLNTSDNHGIYMKAGTVGFTFASPLHDDQLWQYRDDGRHK